MASYKFDIDALNDICVDYGGVGGHTFKIAASDPQGGALNEWDAKLGGPGNFTTNIAAYNDIAGKLGVLTVPFTFTIQALNAISAALGGSSSYLFDIDALNAIADLPIGGAGGQTMKTWNDGLPFSFIGVSSPTTGGLGVWVDGLPIGLSI